jgi:hypothetical protein
MKNYCLLPAFLLVFFFSVTHVPLQAQLLTPVRTAVDGFPEWTDQDVGGTGYLQLLVANASTTTPILDFSPYDRVQLDFRIRTFGGTNPVENEVTIAVSEDNGENWVVVTTRLPLTASLTAAEPVDLSAFSGNQVKVRLSVAGSLNAVGAGIDDISIMGFVGHPRTLSLRNDGEDFTSEVFPVTDYAGAVVTLPTLQDCGHWQFSGWDTNPDKQSAPAFAGGAEYITTDADVTLYAIYSSSDYSGESWSMVIDRNDLTNGMYVILNGDFYLPNDRVSNGPEHRTIDTAGVSVAGGSLVGTVTADMRWNFIGNADEMTIKSAANDFFLYNINNNDGVNVGATSAHWTFETYEDGFAMRDGTHSRFCAVYTAGSDWRSYVTRNSVNYKTNRGILNIFKQSGTILINYSANPGCNSESTSWTGAVSVDWTNSANWTQGVPQVASAVTINMGQYIPQIVSAVEIAGLTIDAAAGLTITDAGSLTVGGDVRLISSRNGTACLVNHGSLSVTGIARVEQYLTAATSGSATDNWWYVSMPVLGATSSSVLVANADNQLGYYSEATANYPQVLNTDEVLEVGRGYLAKINISDTYVFAGALNDGTIGPLTLTRTTAAGGSRGFNLIGNPYASFINWNQVTGFGTGSLRRDIRPTIWLRTRNAAGQMIFDTFDGEDGTSLGIGGRVNQFIAPLQAFWVKVEEEGSSPAISFTNAMRLHRSQVEDRLRTPENSLRRILHLQLSSGLHLDETIIATSNLATNGFDFYDSEKMPVDGVGFFSLVEGKELVINKLHSMEPGTTITLGMSIPQAGTYTIKASELINLDNVQVVLYDRVYGIKTLLQPGTEHRFAVDDATQSTERFSIELLAPGTLSSVVNSMQTDVQVHVLPGGLLQINAGEMQMSATVRVYSLSGQQVLEKPITGRETQIRHALLPGIYIVKVNDQVCKIRIHD